MDNMNDGALPPAEPWKPMVGEGDGVPFLRVNVFGRFEVLFDGQPMSGEGLRSRRVKTLLGILAVNHGRELYCEYLADSFWPDSPTYKQRNSFYNLWYKMTRDALPPDAQKSLYFLRQQYSCQLLDQYVLTDVAEAELACRDLERPDLDPVEALAAYRRLQQSYCGDLLPGETSNAIVLRSRSEWRNRVVEALYAAARCMQDQGEASAALWLVEAAGRVDEMREDLVRLRMRLLMDLGRPSAALRAYDDMRLNLMHKVGTGPSVQSSELVQELVEAIPIERQSPVVRTSRRRGKPGRAQPAAAPIPQRMATRR